MKEKFFKIMGFCLAIVMVVGCTLSLTGCGKQDVAPIAEEKASLVGTVWVADYVITDGAKVFVEEAIQQGLLEEGRSFVLEFTDDSHCSFSRVYDGHIMFSDDFQYAFESGTLQVTDASVESASFDSEDGIFLTQRKGDSEATFHFVESENIQAHDNEPNTIAETPDTTIETPDNTDSSTHGEIQTNSNGEYIYRVGDCEFASSINIWNYINGTDFNLYGMLEDHGFEIKMRKVYTYDSNMTKTEYKYEYIEKASTDDLLIIFEMSLPSEAHRTQNSYGLYPLISFEAGRAMFAISDDNQLDAKYSINGTDIGMSIDQISVMAFVIAHTTSENGRLYYTDVFAEMLASNKARPIFIIP